ncbi:MAG: glycosyl transferase [Chloroflexi bacterium OHK40]
MITPSAHVVLSITSIPERIELFLGALGWLAQQRVQPWATVIWLGEESFTPERRRELAARFPLPPGVEIRYRPDLGPQTKLLYALREFAGLPIVTADDDVIYPPDWLAGLYAAYQEAPACIHCWRAHRIRLADDGTLAPYRAWEWLAPGVQGPSHRLFPTGTCGTLYPPGALASEVFNLGAMRELCPTADDTWFKAMALLQGTPARKVQPDSVEFPHIAGSERKMLWTVNEGRNDAQLAAVFERYQLYERLATPPPMPRKAHRGS